MNEAIVMAAGEGRRLRPLTDRWPKPLLPIDGRPVLGFVLRELAAAGCNRVSLVTGHLAEQLEGLVGDGRAFGVLARFVRQPRAEGSADAVRRALEAGAVPPLLVVGADTRFATGDVARFARVFSRSGACGACALTRDPSPSAARSAVVVENGRVVRIAARLGVSPLAGSPLWGLTDTLRPCLDGLDGPPYELGQAYQRAIDAGEEIRGVEIGKTRDLTDPLDVVEENFPYLRSR